MTMIGLMKSSVLGFLQNMLNPECDECARFAHSLYTVERMEYERKIFVKVEGRYCPMCGARLR
jgi:hypothetical protein